MRILKQFLAFGSAVLLAFGAFAAKTPKAVVTDEGKALTFVYDDTTYSGTKDVDWFIVNDESGSSGAYPRWKDAGATVETVTFAASFAGYAPPSCYRWFSGFAKLATINGIANLNTSQTTSLSGMFEDCSALKSLDLSHFDTSNVTTLYRIFDGCSSLEAINLKGLDTSKVTDMRFMFDGCSSLATLDVLDFDTQNVTTMASMFDGCSSLTRLDVSGFDTAKVKDMSGMFARCPKLAFLDISGFDTSSATLLCGMFSDCEALESIDVSGFKTQDVVDMSTLFYGCKALKHVDVSGFDTAQVTRMVAMFQECSSLTSLDLSGFDTSKTTVMNYMFYRCSALKRIFASESFATEQVTDSEGMFLGCTALLGGLGTSFDSTRETAAYARIDGGPSSSESGYFSVPKAVWESGGQTLRFTVSGRDGLEKDAEWFSLSEAMVIDPRVQDVPWADCGNKVINVVFDPSFRDYRPRQCGSWFYRFFRLTRIDGFENLDVSYTTSLAFMFTSCDALEVLDLSSFDTARVTDMDGMFKACPALRTIYASEKFSTERVDARTPMFTSCYALVGDKGTSYDDESTTAVYARLDGGTSAPGFFSAKAYEICFHKYDGTTTATTQDFAVGASATLPTLAKLGWTRRAMTFKGWATSEANAKAKKVWKTDGASVKDATTVGRTLDVYAVWTLAPNAYAIQYVRNDGAGYVRTVGFYRDQTYNLNSIVGLGWARRGYDFLGWATSTANARDGKVWKTDGATFRNVAAAGQMQPVYGMWKLKPGYYEIKFNKNDGTGKWRALGYEYGKETKLSTCENGFGWTRAGYTFKGWATSSANAAAGKVWKADGATVSTAAAAGKTLNVYAVWLKNAACIEAPPISYCQNFGATASCRIQSEETILETVVYDAEGEDYLALAKLYADGTAEALVWTEEGTAEAEGAGALVEGVLSLEVDADGQTFTR